MRVLVVGNGIAGSSFTRLARGAGLDVTVCANSTRRRASIAALCVTRPSWFTGATRRECEWVIDWYRSHGWLTTSEAHYSSYRLENPEVRPDYFSLDPAKPLVDADVDCDWGDLTGVYDLTVLARGAGSDLDWRRQYGSTTISDLRGAPPIAAYHDRPRSVMFACSNDNKTVRFGSSKATNEATAIERQQRDYEKAVALGLVTPGNTSMITGVRLMPPKGTPAGSPRWLTPTTVAVEGFGRVGYSLAPARMKQLLEEVTA